MSLDRFYPIFDSADWLARLVPLGIRLTQLRIKDRPEPEIRAEIRRALAICNAHDCTLVINDYWRLAIEEDCTWLHLGQEDLAEADLPAIRRAGLKLGVSTHDEAELATALATQPDYLALGPIYPTILKKMKWEQQGLARLTEWKAAIGEIPLVAIGGMSVERAPGAFEAGADIVSAVTDITLHENPEQRIHAWLKATRAS